MKKIFAIAMLVLLLFNIGGYQLFFNYFIYHSDASIEKNINQLNYKAADLFEVKIPYNRDMRSVGDWDSYKQVSGQVNYKGICYNYAEIKIANDTLYLRCIPNKDKSRLVNANVNYAKEINDIPVNKKDSEPVAKKALSLSEYDFKAVAYKYCRYFTLMRQIPAPVKFTLDKPYIEAPGQPPNFAV